MATHRKAAEAEILKYIKALEGGDINVGLYEVAFSRMDDAAFEAFITGVEREEIYLSIIAPNGGDVKLDVDRSMKVGGELGVNYYQHLLITDPISGETTKTPKKYMVCHLPLRRQAQHLIKKQSLPGGSNIIDQLTGQVTGEDKGARLSIPDALALDARGMHYSLEELMKSLGGDQKAYREYLRQIRETGTVDLELIRELGSKPTSTETLSALLYAIHIENTLGKQ